MKSIALLFDLFNSEKKNPIKMNEFLLKNKKFDKVKLYSKNVTKFFIIHKLYKLAYSTHTDHTENIWIYFLCNGFENSNDDRIVCQDEVINKYEFQKILNIFSEKSSVVFIFDCCYNYIANDFKYDFAKDQNWCKTDFNSKSKAKILMISGIYFKKPKNKFEIHQYTGLLTDTILLCLKGNERIMIILQKLCQFIKKRNINFEPFILSNYVINKETFLQ